MSVKYKNEILATVLTLLQHNESDTSSDSDSSTEEFLISVTSTLHRLSENLTQDYSTEQFLCLYRIHPKLFLTLAGKYEISPFYRPNPAQGGGRPAIPPAKQVLIFLWYAGQRQATMKSISQQFDISLDRSCKVLHRMSAFLGTLSEEAISWQNREEKQEALGIYYERTGIPNIVGALDQMHVRIITPVKDPELYMNDQKYHSIHLQAICDHRFRFLDVFVGYPGSIEPAQVIKNSFIYPKLPKLCKDTCLVGNVCYEINPWCLVPYKESELNNAQENFNTCLQSVLLDVQQTFEILKERFPCLNYLRLREMQTACEVIMGCCILHNLSDVSDLQVFHRLSNGAPNAAMNNVNCELGEQDCERAVAAAKEIRDSLAEKLLNSRT